MKYTIVAPVKVNETIAGIKFVNGTGTAEISDNLAQWFSKRGYSVSCEQPVVTKPDIPQPVEKPVEKFNKKNKKK